MQDAALATRKWIDSVVIDLGLCPFAAAVVEAGQLRIVCSDARDAGSLATDLDDEIALLLQTPVEEVETTLLVHPKALLGFGEYNDFLGTAEALLVERRCEGVLQLASFHPNYQFEGEAIDDAANWTNRSPFPMLHLLREASVEAAIANFGDTASIPERNIARLRELGPDQARARLAACFGIEESA